MTAPQRKNIRACIIETWQGCEGEWFWRVVRPKAGRLAAYSGSGKTRSQAWADAERAINKALGPLFAGAVYMKGA